MVATGISMKLGHKLPLAFAAVVLVVVSAALLGLYSLNRAIAVYDTQMAGNVVLEHTVADIESEFKTQVKEWKNVLLRGSKPEDFDNHWQAFSKVESHVYEEASKFSALLPAGESRSLVSQFAQAHQQMGVVYRKLLEAALLRIETDSAAVATETAVGARRTSQISLGQIASIVTEMSHTTQQNAALVEEMAAAAEGLRVQAKELVHTVAVFKLDAGGGVTNTM
jgi:methyl-accepting chemotaxis protein-1 (serine sensor receptor)